jgi:hypothetical protein
MTTRISTLPSLATVTDATIIPVVEGGATKRITGAALKTYTGSGKIVQVAQTIVPYKQSTSNTSYTLLAAANAFTPTSASNKILVQITGQYGNSGSSGNGDIAVFRTIGGGSAGNIGTVINTIGGTMAAYESNSMAIAILDNPATTSAVVYALYGIRTDGLAVPFVGGRNTDGYYPLGTYFTLMEVAP